MRFLPGATSTVFAPLDWLIHGMTSTELYRERKRKTSISYDKLLLRAANEAVKARWENLVRDEKASAILTWKQVSGKDGVTTKALRLRMSSEARCREFISPSSQSKMEKSFDVSCHKRECSLCCYDLYLSAAICSCSPSKYSCWLHAKHLCSFPWIEKVFLFRYQMSVLNILLEAVEGKITPMQHWVREELGLVLEWNNTNQGENGLIKDPRFSASEPSDGRFVSTEKGGDLWIED